MFRRLCNPSLSNSFFLFGARGTGKTMLIEKLFQVLPHFKIDLLDDELAREFRKYPKRLKFRFEAYQGKQKSKWIVLDEVQRSPPLLNIAHQMMEKDKVHFALTGSSARKLKRGGANLLAGRAFVYHLFPLTFLELGTTFHLPDVMAFGTLPKLYALQSIADKKKYLNSYVQTYIKEEIQLEQVVRNLDPFQDFLQISAQMSSKIINSLKISKEVGVDSKTVSSYFRILEETWLGFRLPGYHKSIRKAQRILPKFYWFDLGVRRTLEDTLDFPPAPGTSYYGECFEELVINEIYRLNHYTEKHYRMSYLSTTNSDIEVDVVLDKGRGRKTILIEIKSSNSIDETEVRKLARLKKEFSNPEIYYLTQAPEAEIIDGVSCMDWQSGLEKIFQ